MALGLTGRPAVRYDPPPRPVGVLEAAELTRILDRQWRRSSYSSLTAGASHHAGGVTSEPEAPGTQDEPEPDPDEASAAVRDRGRDPVTRPPWPICPWARDLARSCTPCWRWPISTAPDLAAELHRMLRRAVGPAPADGRRGVRVGRRVGAGRPHPAGADRGRPAPGRRRPGRSAGRAGVRAPARRRRPARARHRAAGRDRAPAARATSPPTTPWSATPSCSPPPRSPSSRCGATSPAASTPSCACPARASSSSITRPTGSGRRARTGVSRSSPSTTPRVPSAPR